MQSIRLDENRIDFAVAWVDGEDAAFRAAMAGYCKTAGEAADCQGARFRDWGLLKYWFRGVEKFAPWAGMIHFVTWGHLPPWLNSAHPKLNIVRHEDYIPREYLPTFSSHTIELNLHRIASLSEKFVYFNDDMFLTAPVEPGDFFKGSLPCDAAVEAPIQFFQRGVRAETIDMAAINRNFAKRRQMMRHFAKWWNPRYGLALAKTFFSLPYGKFLGFLTPHAPSPFLKSTFAEVWEKEGALLNASSRHRFRDMADANQWIFKYWQLASGRFAPRNLKFCRFFEGASELENAAAAIRAGRAKCICWNDSDDISDFAAARSAIQSAFEVILPDKSSFEK